MAEDTAAAEAADSTGAGAAVFMEVEEAASTEVAGSAEADFTGEAEDFMAVAASAAEDLGDIAGDTEAIAEGLAQDVPTHRRLAEAATDEDSAAPTAADTGQDVMAGLMAAVTDMVADGLARAGRAREQAVLGRQTGDSAHQAREVILA